MFTPCCLVVFADQCTSRVPYTATTFVVYEHVLEQAYEWVDKATISGPATTAINLRCSIVPRRSFPKQLTRGCAKSTARRARPEKIHSPDCRESQGTRAFAAAYGLPARSVMVGGMTAVQFGIYGDIKAALGASRGIEIK